MNHFLHLCLYATSQGKISQDDIKSASRMGPRKKADNNSASEQTDEKPLLVRFSSEDVKITLIENTYMLAKAPEPYT